MADKKLSFIISADNNPAIKALSEMGVALSKIGSAFKAINATQKASLKSGAGGAFDPKDLNAASEALKDVSSGFKSLGVNQQQYERGNGFKNLQNGFKGTTRAAKEFHSAITDILRPLMALTGIGSVGGVMAMADRYSKTAREVQRTSFLTGASTSSIQSLVNRGQMFGMAPDETMGAFRGISSSIEDAVQGRNYPFLAFLQRQEFGIGDVSKAYNAPGGVEKIISKVLVDLQKNYKNPRERAGLLENTPFASLIPLLMYGDKEAGRRNAMGDKFGATGSNEAILRYESSMDGLNLAMQTLNRNMTILVAKASPMIDFFSGYISSTNGAKDATSLLAAVVGLGLVAAFDLLAVAVKRNPVMMAIWGIVTVVDLLYNHWSDFVAAFKLGMAYITGDNSWTSRPDPIAGSGTPTPLIDRVMSTPNPFAFGGNAQSLDNHSRERPARHKNIDITGQHEN